jgi:prepilin-type processing-associated H-X9-DG protein/prepilin-type N-terminal cleavage/methylation domain-containing protein
MSIPPPLFRISGWKPNRRNWKAFTLVELLTVVAIVGLLAGLSLASFLGAKRKALQIQCANNVRQFGLVIQQFLGDYHAYPLAANPGFFSGQYQEHHSTWISAIERSGFSENKQTREFLHKGVWHCPSFYRPADVPGNRGLIEYGYNGYGVSPITATNSLGLGGHLGTAQVNHGTNAPPILESEVAIPVDMIALGDGFSGNGDDLVEGGLWRTPSLRKEPNLYGGVSGRVKSRHNGRANIAFCDGHIEPMTLKSLFQDNGSQSLSRWNRDHQAHSDLLVP